MASSSSSSSFVLQSPFLRKSYFLGETHHLSCYSPNLRIGKMPSTIFHCIKPTAKFNLFEIMGGRGICNGEEGLQELLNKPIESETEAEPPQKSPPTNQQEEDPPNTTSLEIPENAFDKELLGLTGGFPGGEKGLQSFLDKNPPPPPPKKKSTSSSVELLPNSKSQPPQLPLLMPGMIAIVKNPNHPFYMYCGIIQRITDGKAGVLFEGGNWDKLITFRLDELERRDKGPPMVNPKSVTLENIVQNESS